MWPWAGGTAAQAACIACIACNIHPQGMRALIYVSCIERPPSSHMYPVCLCLCDSLSPCSCNESSIITRNFAELALPPGGSTLAAVPGAPGAPAVDLYPQQLRADIDRWNDRIYETGGAAWQRCSIHNAPLPTAPP